MTAESSMNPKETATTKKEEEQQRLSLEDADSILSCIASKIMGVCCENKSESGVTQLDLDQLAILAESDVYQKHIPYLHRKFLSSPPPSSNHKNSPPIVRYVGMVQDMLDPEYYMSKMNNKCTKYCDYVYNQEEAEQVGDEEIDAAHYLKERQPLVIVPLPFVSDWVTNGIIVDKKDDENEGKKAEKKKVEKEGSKKRERDDDNENDKDETLCRNKENSTTNDNDGEEAKVSKKQQLPPTKNAPMTSNKNNNCSTDWWPKGCMKSDENQCPILAKVYYDDDDDSERKEGEKTKTIQNRSKKQNYCHRRLRLNDVVELIGVVYMDPMDADFTHQQQQQQQNKSCANNNSKGDNAIMDFDSWWSDNPSSDFEDAKLVLPPPSLLPRFHVLNYKILDLDLMSNKIAVSSSLEDKEEEEQMVVDGEKEVVSMSTDVQNINGSKDENDRDMTIATFAKYFFHENKHAAEALLMTLLSMAQREEVEKNSPKEKEGNFDRNVVKTPTDATLGCASLNFTLPNANKCVELEKRLYRVLKEVVPIVGSATLSLQTLQDDNNHEPHEEKIVAPTKSPEGRLQPSVMQLPKGSTLLIQQANMKEGKVDGNGQRSLLALSSLTSKHTLPYRFDGMLDYNFEADYRIIVISSATKHDGGGGNGQNRSREQQRQAEEESRNKILPCMMNMTLDPCKEEGQEENCDMDVANEGPEDDVILPHSIAQRIRAYLSRCRIGQNNNANIALSREIVAQAEKDFVQRRSECRSRRTESNPAQCQGGAQRKQHLVGEEDLHMWLTLARLQARSRIAATDFSSSQEEKTPATLQDWNAALKLYDAMMMSH